MNLFLLVNKFKPAKKLGETDRYLKVLTTLIFIL